MEFTNTNLNRKIDQNQQLSNRSIARSGSPTFCSTFEESVPEGVETLTQEENYQLIVNYYKTIKDSFSESISNAQLKVRVLQDLPEKDHSTVERLFKDELDATPIMKYALKSISPIENRDYSELLELPKQELNKRIKQGNSLGGFNKLIEGVVDNLKFQVALSQHKEGVNEFQQKWKEIITKSPFSIDEIEESEHPDGFCSGSGLASVIDIPEDEFLRTALSIQNDHVSHQGELKKIILLNLKESLHNAANIIPTLKIDQRSDMYSDKLLDQYGINRELKLISFKCLNENSNFRIYK
jgi:hypothetical protein